MCAKKPAQAVIQGGPDFGHCIQGGSTWALCICVRTKASPAVYTQCIRLYVRVRTIVYDCIRVYAQLYRARPVMVACPTDCWALGIHAHGPIRHPQPARPRIANLDFFTSQNAIHVHYKSNTVVY